MSTIGLRKVLDGDLVRRFQGLSAAGSGANSLTAAFKGGGDSQSLSAGLRTGAKTFANAVQGMNSVISLVNITESTLEGLGKVTDKLITITERATGSNVGQ